MRPRQVMDKKLPRLSDMAMQKSVSNFSLGLGFMFMFRVTVLVSVRVRVTVEG